eukprot:TRINITY_DN34718_c0_g1_i1.p1 TRINITY_DN34718_c0_g1~~TRINITY_DN34718_c0_g1_i1.p1  ORF type:complete len:858 (+),score=181.64 TRINITY_DN34718_c0_g1_i1:79-2652(+)
MGRFGKKKSGRGGGKGRGRGNVGKRKRRAMMADASGDEGQGSGSDEPQRKRAKGKGKGKDKRKGGDSGKDDTVDPVSVPPPPRPRPKKPGFDALLQSYGATDGGAASDEEDELEEAEDEEEVADIEEDADDCQEDASLGADGGATTAATAIGKRARRREADDEFGGDDEKVEEMDEEEDGTDVEATPGAPSVHLGDGTTFGEDGGHDFYPHFWDDPPLPLANLLQSSEQNGTTFASAGPVDAKKKQSKDEVEAFELPSLRRCQARWRSVPALRELLSSPAEAAAAWRNCALAPGLRAAFEELLRSEGIEIGPREGALFFFLHAYLDVSFPQHTHVNGRAVRAISMLHIVDHVLKASTEVLRNAKTATRAERPGRSDVGLADVAPGSVQDKGFSRARVLVLCPFRSTCYELVMTLLALCPSKKEVANKSRFEEEFGWDGEDDDAKGDKPADWRYLFEGDNDDSFRLGLAISRKQVRLYAPFDNCDVLICSPLGLRKIIGAEGDRRREFDFLSSIEVCVLDRADALRMQNWEHVIEVLGVVGRQPLSMGSVDISRLRPAFADGRARAFRQTVVTSAVPCVDADALFTMGCDARRGGVTGAGVGAGGAAAGGFAKKLGLGRTKRQGGRGILDSDDEHEEGTGDVAVVASKLFGTHSKGDVRSCRGLVRLADLSEGGPMQRATASGVSRQFFLHAAPCGSLGDRDDCLFQTFENKYWKPLGHSLQRLLVVAHSYLGFLRLRRFLRDASASFCSAFEYSEQGKISHARQQFYHGERSLLLVTERFLWYRRYKIKGADYILFYGAPETPAIYEDVLGQARTPSQCNSMTLFTKYDAGSLEGIVGHERARKMVLSEAGKVFVFS